MVGHLKHVEVVHRNDGVVEVRMNRPDKRNAMNKRMWGEIGFVFAEVLPRDPTCRCIVLSGNGKVFSSGIDLVETMSGGGLAGETAEGGADVARRGLRVLREGGAWQAAWSALNECRVPVIAAVHGGCYGAALELIAFADIRMCTVDTIFRSPEVDIGIAADIGGNQMLPKVVGNDSLLRELQLSGRSMLADEALRFGLVSRVLDDRKALMTAALDLAGTIALKSPLAVVGTKTLLNYTRDHTVSDSLRFGLTWNACMVQSRDLLIAGTALVAKQTPTFESLPVATASKL